MTYPRRDHHGRDARRHDHDESDGEAQAEILDLDAEVLAEYTASITEWLPLTAAPRRIVDLGCGTGAGTFALLSRFPDAHVTAVDVSVDHLQRVCRKACSLGVDQRLHTVHADLDTTWPDLGEPDLVWASASVHHLADPDRTLRRVRDILAPGGLFALVEVAGFPRFLPSDAPAERPGLEDRCHAVADLRHARHLPHRGADWGPRLMGAGFGIVAQRTVVVDVRSAAAGAVPRYALRALRSIRQAVGDALEVEDLAALDGLLDADDPRSILRRTDLAVRTGRSVWAARRGR